MNASRTRNIMLYITIALVLIFIVIAVNATRSNDTSIEFNEFVNQLQRGRIARIEIAGETVGIRYLSGEQAVVRKDPGSSLEEQLISRGVSVETINGIEWINRPTNNVGGAVFTLITAFLPVLIIGGILLFILRQSQGVNNQAMAFGKSRARMFSGDRPTVTFADVAGCDEAKYELTEIVEFLKEPEKFVQLGARIPKGVLMIGSPGTGKTLLSKAVAGEAGVPFFSISGSEFVEMFVGVGASRVRDLFEQAKRHSPAIIFIDEIDAVGRQRGAGLGGSHDEREQTLNQILVEMDGFDTDTNVIIIAATNRPDILDPALTRPGRFDRRVVIDRPDLKGREQILRVHVRGKPLAADVDLELLARATPGFVGADLENMVNEGAILAARKNKKTINLIDLQEAIERVILGPERRSRVMSDKEKRIVAYHEAGHAVLGHLLPHADPVSKVTIIPRGMAGGVTIFLPEEESIVTSRSQLREHLVVMLGGRAAEAITFGEITTGASDDIQRVTRIARSMVTRFGMSDKLGPMIFGQKEEMIFLGREISEQRDYSEAVAQEIDAEVRLLVDWAYSEALKILRANTDKLEVIAQALLQIETLDSHDFEGLMNGGSLNSLVKTLTETSRLSPPSPQRQDPPLLPNLGNPNPSTA